MSDKMNGFVAQSRKEYREFARLCCGIRKKEAVLQGHKASVKHRREKEGEALKHYSFFKKRLQELCEWERSMGGDGLPPPAAGYGKADAGGAATAPGQGAPYCLLDLQAAAGVPVNGDGKRILCPFPFVKAVTVVRDLSSEEN